MEEKKYKSTSNNRNSFQIKTVIANIVCMYDRIKVSKGMKSIIVISRAMCGAYSKI